MDGLVVDDMNHNKGVVELRMAVLKTVKTFHLTRSAISGVIGTPYNRMVGIIAEFERNKLVEITDKKIYLTSKGQRILARYDSLLKDLNIRTIY